LLTEAHLAGANVTWMGSLKAFGTLETDDVHEDADSNQ